MSKTNFVGVSKIVCKGSIFFVASIRVDGQKHYLGCHKDFDAAKKARIDAEIAFFGKPLNKQPAQKLTDHEIDLMRQLHEDGMPQKVIVEKFEISKGHASKIIRYIIR